MQGWERELAAPARILVVDDQPANIHVLNNVLQAQHRIFVATSGLQALRQAQTVKPDLILLDVVMPGMDGYEVCRQLKQDETTRHIPVIFVTGRDEVEDEVQGLACGAVDFITKPVSPPILQARVQTHLALKRQSDLLHSWVYLDGLTGMANRRHFNERLDVEGRRCARALEPLSVVILDVDHFKRFNDFYGHQSGDACLVRVAGALRDCLKRPADMVARYGGEEFVGLLPGSDSAGALQVGQRLVEAVRELAIPHANSPTGAQVTASAGVATLVPRSSMSMEQLVARADQWLYQAKDAGRDRALGER